MTDMTTTTEMHIYAPEGMAFVDTYQDYEGVSLPRWWLRSWPSVGLLFVARLPRHGATARGAP